VETLYFDKHSILAGDTRMLCPACGTQNELNQRYCRQCRKALTAVRIILGGNAEPSVATRNSSSRAVCQLW
jgi:predicted amidophosphoribosyltransferase